MHPRTTVYALAVLTGCAAVACSLLVDTGGLAGSTSDAGTSSPDGASIDGASNDDAGLDGGFIVAACAAPGLEQGAAWPMSGGCVTHTGQSAFNGPARGSEKWFRALASDGGVGFASPVIDRDGIVYVGVEEDDAGMVAVRPDGTVRWQAPVGNVSDSVALAANGTIAAATGGGIARSGVVSLFKDGTQNWHLPVKGEGDTAPAIGDDGTIYTGVYGWGLVAVAPEGGVARFFIDGGSPKPPAIDPSGNVYFGDHLTDVLRAIGPNGAPSWTIPVSDPTVTILSGDTLYLGAKDGNVYALAVATGAAKWTHPTAAPPLTDPALSADGALYVGASDEKLHCLDAQSGKERWAFTAQGTLCTPLLDASGNVYFASGARGAQTLFSVDAQGKQRWTAPLPSTNGSCSGQPALAADGTLYVLTDDATLHAFEP